MPAYNKVIYNGKTLIDLSGDTVDENTVLEGYTGHKADGTPFVGTFKGGSETEEIDRILTSGLTDGYKYFYDDGTIISTSQQSGMTLTKTFNKKLTQCTTVLRDQSGNELGRTVKDYTRKLTIITTVDHLGRKLVKTFDKKLRNLETILYDPDGGVIAQLHKTFSKDGKSIETTAIYNE